MQIPSPSAASPTPITTIMAQVLEKLRRSQQTQVDIAAWRAIAGHTLAAHSAPETCQQGRLTVRVDRPAALFVLHLKRRALLRQLQQRLGADVVAELSFRLGSR